MHLASRSLDIDEGYSTMTVKRMVMDRDRNPWNDHAARYSELIAERNWRIPRRTRSSHGCSSSLACPRSPSKRAAVDPSNLAALLRASRPFG